jgi:AhpD family alkylhydroperoxidase
MEDSERKKIGGIIKTRKLAHSYFSKRSAVYRAFSEMERQTYRNGAITKKNKELIAVGISVVINCESCMEWHIGQAIEDGATEEEIIEAIEVGIEMSGGPGTVSARFAMIALEHYMDKEKGRKG